MPSDIDHLSELIKNQSLEGDDSIFSPGYENGLKNYLSHYLWTLIETLQDHYPTLIIALSEDNFNYFARKYILDNGSEHEDLELFGTTFIDFLSKQQELKNMKNLLPQAKIDELVKNKFISPNTVLKVPSGSLLLWESIHAKQDIEAIHIDHNTEESIKLELENEEHYLVKMPKD